MGPFATTRLASGTKAGRADEFLLNLLVATVGNVRAIREKTHVFGEGISKIHTGFAAAKDRHNLSMGVGGLADSSGSLGESRLFGELDQVGEASAGARDVRLHCFGKALVPKADGLVASVLNLLGDGAARRVGSHNHDDLFLLSIGVYAASVTGMF
jgi:hypothetical protein